MKNIYTALIAFQGESKNIPFDCEVKGTYRFEYASFGQILNHIRPLLSKNNLGFSQSIDLMWVTTTIFHNSGEYIEAKCPMLPIGEKKPQEAGSLISYMKRYALLAALGLVGDQDDDANIAQGYSVQINEKPSSGVYITEEGNVKYNNTWINLKLNDQEKDLLRKADKAGKDILRTIEYIEGQRK